MSKLILSLDGSFLGEFPLEGKSVTIGRRPTNDIHLDNLAVSGEHARIITVDGVSVLEDLDSTNGSTLNGVMAKKQALRHGDVIGIGKYQLRFVDEAALGSAARTAPTDFENTIMMQPTTAPQVRHQPPPGVPQAADGAAAANLPPPAKIQVLNGAAVGREMVLSKSLTTLGKSGEQVAVITRRPNGYFITHVEGQQHPTVNGAAIGIQAHALADHDVIELAGVKMEFFLDTSA